MRLRATLFGTLTIFDEQGRPLDVGSPTARGLLAYLLLHRREIIERRHLAFSLWPHATERAARRNLRQYLHRLRLIVKPFEQEGEILVADGATLRFSPQVEFDLDIEAFEHGLRPQAALEEARRALALYRGDLLEDVYDDWCTAPREHFRRLYIGALERLSAALQSVGRLEEALAYAQQWVKVEPLDENAHQRLITLYALSGDRLRAMAQYQALVRLLEQEVHAQPLPETQALIQSIQQGNLNPSPAWLTPSATRSYTVVRSPLTVPLVGRQSELEQLEGLYRQAQQGEGRLVLLSGEAGIGKTRLIQEHLARHPESDVLHGVCYELESMQPFAPLRSALEESALTQAALAGQRTSPPGWVAPLLSVLPSLRPLFPYMPYALESNALLVREALIDLLLHLSHAARAPLHLVLDDLHWADIPTLELLAGLARQARRQPLLIIGLYRAEDLTLEQREWLRTIERSGLAWSLEVGPLTMGDTTRLAEHLAPPRAADRLFCERLYQDTEGNPFFVIEAVQAVQEGETSVRFPLLTASIQQVIAARFERLTAASREALAGAAAIGRPFSLALLETILERPAAELVAYLEEWSRRGIVQEARQGYDFRHDKFRQVAYGLLSRARREYLHRRIAETLNQLIPPADASTLAYHYARSDQPLQALPHLTRAGEQALRLRSYHEARQFGLQAINLLGQMPGPASRAQRIEINLQLAQAYAFSGDLDRAIELLNETEHLALSTGEEHRLGAIFRRAAQFFWLRGQPEAANDYARRALRAAEETNDSALLYAALRMLGRTSIALSAFDDAIAHLTRYVKQHEDLSARPSPPHSLPEDLPIVLGYLGVAYSRVGSWERAYAMAQRGLSLAQRTFGEGHATTFFALMQLAMLHAGYTRWQLALKVLTPIPALPLEEVTPPLYMALSLRGYALAHLGRVEEGLSILEEANRWAEQAQHRVFHYLPRLFLARARLLNREGSLAHQEAGRALEEARQANDRWAVGVGLHLLAEIEMRQRTPPWEQIEARLLESMHLLRQIRARPELARTYLALRRLYDRAGQIAWAVDCHFRAVTIFEELGMLEELQQAQGQAARERRGAVVLPDLPLRGPNRPLPRKP